MKAVRGFTSSPLKDEEFVTLFTPDVLTKETYI